MEVGHDKETNSGDNDANKLDFLIRRNTRSEIIGDFLIIYSDSCSCDKNNKSSEKPCKVEAPIHRYKYTLFCVKIKIV